MVSARLVRWVAGCSLFASCGLLPATSHKRLRVPEVMRPSPADKPGAHPPSVLRVVEHGRVWELQVPQRHGAWELRVPLDASTQAPLEKLIPHADGGLTPADERQHYQQGMSNIQALYSGRRYELALSELGQLERSFPNDARLLTMKGSLHLKLGDRREARAAWERALAQNPEDSLLAEALRGLSEEELLP